MTHITNKGYRIAFVNTIVVCLCIITSVIIWFDHSHDGYKLLFLHPLTFSIAYLFVLSKKIHQGNKKLFFMVFMGIASIRYVVLPLLIVLSGHYGGRSFIEPDQASFLKAILLMNYELIVCSVFIGFKEWRKGKKGAIKKPIIETSFEALKGYDIGYICFGVLTVVGVVTHPTVLLSINFIIPNVFAKSIEYSFTQNLVIYFVVVFKQLLFIMVTKKLFYLFKQSKKHQYITYNFLVALLNILTYFGTNRSDIVISAIVSFFLLYKLYGQIMKKYFALGSIALVLLIMLVTSARDNASISGHTNGLLDITDTFQVYTGGPYNVAIAVETKSYFPEANDVSVLFFDIFRPMIGVNFLVKELPFQYSNIFYNKRLWLDIDRRSQILPMIGQGNLFFGFILAPLFSLFFIRLHYYFEKKVAITKSVEIFYFVNLAIVRLGFFMGQNTMNMINDMSMNLVLFLGVYSLNKLTKRQVIHKKHVELNKI
ncbi:hypothetical protein HZI73_06435 [Vallitalea pronyensis]|uniref:Oligosaccharide repeat unit polymerase n=1 Tax=Vallitalea pronyensis TaxID=1348613 RepID=A0A8J8MHW6_9FIRM|nr:hypothetical protein [Vallitalea pronyensis]QUI21960.1 hypothetical protein HZI73_06435 [Vallitalea pronyensis]